MAEAAPPPRTEAARAANTRRFILISSFWTDRFGLQESIAELDAGRLSLIFGVCAAIEAILSLAA
jgi:hypothetical protein